MKKYSLIIVCLLVCSVMISGCRFKIKPIKKQQTINYQRKLEKYLPAENSSQKTSSGIDLSEGPKLKYDASFGPREVNFDVKVVNPYNF